MTESQERETKSLGPRDLANRSDDAFLAVVRSAGKAMGGLSSVPVKGISNIGRLLTYGGQKTVKQPTQPEEDRAPRRVDEEKGPPAPQDPHPLPDLEALLEGRSPGSAKQAAVLRKCLDNLVFGSEEAGEAALKILVGLGQGAEPLLVACLPTDSPRVAKLALEGLSRIDAERLIDCISNMLESSDPELRFVALRAAVGLRDSQQQRLLLERGLQDPDADVRRRALSYVAWDDSHWAIAEAMRLCNDKSPDVQWAAVETLIVLRPTEVNSILPLAKPSLAPVNQRRLADLLDRQGDQGVLSDENEERIRNAAKAG